MASDVAKLVDQIHASGKQLVLVVNGGSEAISSLLTVPGASRSVLLAIAPYSSAALAEWLGSRPEQFCSARTARAMAMVAYEKARQLAGLPRNVGNETPESNLLGVACTVSLASDRAKRGSHRFFVATQAADSTTCLQVELEKGRRPRAEEERLAARSILSEIAAAWGGTDHPALELTQHEAVTRSAKTAPASWQALLAGNLHRVRMRRGPAQSAESSCKNVPVPFYADAGIGSQSPQALFPGAFNPLHGGHRGMAKTASQLLGVPIEFEISIANVDKPALDFIEIDERLKQFTADETVWLTRAPTFAEKAALFPGVTFIVGADTLERIALPRYYQEQIPGMLQAIEKIAAAGCRFLVFGRKVKEAFQGLSNLDVPPSLKALCQEVPESDFRQDISSTDLRKQQER